MGKQKPQGVKLLYRKSNCTIKTQSKTCSGASQLLSKSAILQLKETLPKTKYYINNGKLKRDLSMETDVCILRRYCKKKFARFKYSIHTTKARTIDETQGDHSACGDSVPAGNEKPRVNIDITALVVENFKDLLNDWIKKYLLNNDETKQKIQTVLDSILHKLEDRNSSTCTYTLDITVDEDKHSSHSFPKHKVNKVTKYKKQSCQTVPVTGKPIKLISTLSIPRNMKNQAIDNELQTQKRTTHRVRYKNVFLTVSRSSSLLFNSSNFNLLSISTKSFTKRCATYKGKYIEVIGKRHLVILPPKYSCESLENDKNQNDIHPNELEVEPMQSLVKSIYTEDPVSEMNSEKNLCKCKNDNYTMTSTESILKAITSSNRCRQMNWEKAKFSGELQNMKMVNTQKSNGIINIETKSKNNKSTLSSGPSYRVRKTIIRKTALYIKSKKRRRRDRKIRDSPYLQSKSLSCYERKELLQDLRNILNSFARYANNKNFKFDVRINIIHEIEDTNNASDHINKVNSHNVNEGDVIAPKQLEPEIKEENTAKKSQKPIVLPSESEPKLISLLDGAISQSKYVIKKDASFEKPHDTLIEKSTEMSKSIEVLPHLEIAKDINDLRCILKDLANTTANFVKEHLKHEDHQTSLKNSIKKLTNSSSKITSRPALKKLTLSKSVQTTNDKANSPIMSGIKLKKEPKRDIQELNTRLAKKSVSYNVIESEAILKVTDMTSAATYASKGKLDKGLNCVLPRSRSQFQINEGQNKRKLIAYYCDELRKPGQIVQHLHTVSCVPNSCRRTTCPHRSKEKCRLIYDRNCYDDVCEHIGCVGPLVPKCDSSFKCKSCESLPCERRPCEPSTSRSASCSSVYIDIDDRSKKFSVRSRSGVGFWEGFLYCVFLWVPIIVIMWLLYVYVIRDIIQPTNPAVGWRVIRSQNPKNTSYIRISLSDLGF